MVLMDGGGIVLVVVGVMEGGRGVKEANKLDGNCSWVLIAVPAVGGPEVGSEPAAKAALDFFWSSSSSGLEGGVIWLPWPLAASRVATMVLTELAGLPDMAWRATG